MKHFIPVFVLGFLLIQCQPAPRLESSNISIVEKYISAVENQDFMLMDSLTREDFFVVGPSVTDTANKNQIIRRWKRNSKEEIDSIRFRGSTLSQLTIPSKTEIGDWIGEWSLVHIYYKDISEPIKLFANTNYLVVDGKLARGLVFYNKTDILDQMSYIYTKEMIEEVGDSLQLDSN